MAAMAAEHGLSEIEVLSSKIGRITIDWAHLEFDLFTLFRSVLRADDLDAYDALRSEVDIGLAMRVYADMGTEPRPRRRAASAACH